METWEKKMLPTIRIFFLFLCEFVLVAGFIKDCPSNAMARYKMELTGTWAESTLNSKLLPKGFPDRWSWSTGIGVSLDAREDPYYNETVKTKLHNFVKKGGLSYTVSELSRFGSGVLDIFLIPSTASTGADSTTIFFIDSNHSRVSFMSKMNHKPHWMLTVDSVNLCNNGQFREVYELDLFPSESRPRPDQFTSPRSNHPDGHPYGQAISRGSPGEPRAYKGRSPANPARNNPGSNKQNVDPKYLKNPGKSDRHDIISNEVDRNPSYRGYRSGKVMNDPMERKSRLTKTTTSSPFIQPGDPYYGYYNSQRKSYRNPETFPNTINNTPRLPASYPLPLSGIPVATARRNLLLSDNNNPYGQRVARAAGHHVHKRHRSYYYPPNAATHWAQPPYHQSRNFGQQNAIDIDNPPAPPVEVLPRLAVVKFVKIATYHLSHAPSMATRGRKSRMDESAPLPIIIDKQFVTSMYLPYRGLSRGVAKSPAHHRLLGGSAVTGYDYWPSPSNVMQMQTHRPLKTYS